MYITVKQAAEKWDISDRRVRILCFKGRIPGAYQERRAWKIPYDAIKPTDGRYKITGTLIPILEEKLGNLKARRPLTEGELERLNEEFLTEYTKSEKKEEIREIKRQIKNLKAEYEKILKTDYKPEVKIYPKFLYDCFLIDCPRHQKLDK
mgnify:CR=1 FL=1